MLRTKLIAVGAAVAAAGILGIAQSPASAGTGQNFAVEINNFQDWGNFNQDPVDTLPEPTPGDAIRACDFTADGWGVTAYLDSNHNGVFDRTATTSGQPSDYCSPWRGGNIAEGAKVTLKVCNTKSGHSPKNCKQEDFTA